MSLSACGGQQQQPAAPADNAPASSTGAAPASETAPASEAAPAPASPAAEAPKADAAPAAGGDCAVTIVSDDAMKYDPKEISIKSSCKQFSITLEHAGKMPKSAMGHNVVISKNACKDGVLADGMAAGEAANYVKAGDERVVAHTKLLSGGEKDTVTFDVSKLAKGEAYEYYCSFPGHYAMMNGKITLAD